MRALRGMAVVVGLVAMVSVRATAQSDSDIAGWYGLMVTPYGALPPLVTPSMFGTSTTTSARAGLAFEAKYGHWGFGEGEEPWNFYGLGARTGPVGFVLGYGKCEGCDDGIIMGGAEFEWTMVQSPLGVAPSTAMLRVGLRPSVGYTDPMGDQKGNAYSAALDVPFSLSAVVGDGFRIAPFVTPGFGYGGFDDGDVDDSGTRASIAAGVGFMTRGGFAAHFGWRKVIIDGGVSSIGVGFSLAR